MRVGDMVLPVAERDYMFLEDGMSGECSEDVLSEVDWSYEVGIVLEVRDFDPPREYLRVRMLVGGVIGWTYTDYVWVVK